MKVYEILKRCCL